MKRRETNAEQLCTLLRYGDNNTSHMLFSSASRDRVYTEHYNYSRWSSQFSPTNTTNSSIVQLFFFFCSVEECDKSVNRSCSRSLVRLKHWHCPDLFSCWRVNPAATLLTMRTSSYLDTCLQIRGNTSKEVLTNHPHSILITLYYHFYKQTPFSSHQTIHRKYKFMIPS